MEVWPWSPNRTAWIWQGRTFWEDHTRLELWYELKSLHLWTLLLLDFKLLECRNRALTVPEHVLRNRSRLPCRLRTSSMAEEGSTSRASTSNLTVNKWKQLFFSPPFSWVDISKSASKQRDVRTKRTHWAHWVRTRAITRIIKGGSFWAILECDEAFETNVSSQDAKTSVCGKAQICRRKPEHTKQFYTPETLVALEWIGKGMGCVPINHVMSWRIMPCFFDFNILQLLQLLHSTHTT